MRVKVTEKITDFCRFLRVAGCGVGTGEIIDAIRAVDFVGVEKKEDFKEALRAVLVTDRQMTLLFDRVFDLFWQNPAALGKLPDTAKNAFQIDPTGIRNERLRPRIPEAPSISSTSGRDSEAETGEEGTSTGKTFVYSPEEVLRSKRFEDYTEQELMQAKELIRRFRWDVDRRKSRRLERGRKHYRLHMQRTVRKNILSSQDFVTLLWRDRKSKPRPLVVLCDVSGSMEGNTRILLHFIHTLSGLNRKLEAFTFGTRLTRITHYLLQKDADSALHLVTRSVKDWSGGTRIGESIRSFNLLWGRRVLAGGAVVLIISDGWDAGDIDVLEAEVARLHRSCHRLLWLNPNLGYKDYEPLTRGIQAVLPHVDQFLPIHNLHSLTDLGKILSSLHKARGPAPSAPLRQAYGEQIPRPLPGSGHSRVGWERGFFPTVK